MIPEAQLGRLLEALVFSAEKHRRQRRKDAEQSPYVNHPIQVAELLWSAGGIRDMDVLAAAVLHDTLEDTPTLPDEIEARFGPRVLALVQEVSDDKRLPKAERKRLQVEHAAQKSVQAKAIKLADFACNVRDMTDSPPPDWPLERIREYLGWTAQVAAGLRGCHPGLEKRYDSELHRAEKKYSIKEQKLSK